MGSSKQFFRRLKSSEMLGITVRSPDVSKCNISFIFTVKQCGRNFFFYCLTLKIKTIRPFEVPGTINPVIKCNIREDLNLLYAR
jgi:hypothetical protein